MSDYEMIAGIISESTQCAYMINLFCSKFKEDNPRFSEKKFKEACGYDPTWDREPDWDALDKYIKGEGTTFICV
jgi:hypothetical protein